jgi:hypothetical protein
VQGTYLKFTTSAKVEDIQRRLLATGDRELVEASHRDKIWGAGLSELVAKRHRGAWPGQNLLGKALMEVRTRVRAEKALGQAVLSSVVTAEHNDTNAQEEAVTEQIWLVASIEQI